MELSYQSQNTQEIMIVPILQGFMNFTHTWAYQT